MTKNEKAFGLMEILIVLVILSVMVVGTMAGIIQLKRASAVAQQRMTAVQLMDGKLVYYKSDTGLIPAAGTMTWEVPELHHGLMSVTVESLEGGRMKKVTLTALWDLPWHNIERLATDPRDSQESLATVINIIAGAT